MRKTFYCISFATILIMNACKKHIHSEEINSIATFQKENKTGCVKFASSEEFGRFMENLKKESGDNVSKVDVKRLLLQKNINTGNFISLRESLSRDEFVSTQASLFSKTKIKRTTLERSVVNGNSENVEQVSQVEDLDEDDYLVPDPYLACVLNEQREIEIENTVYKITEFGTYMYEPGQEVVVNTIIDSLRSKGYVLDGSLIPGEISNGNGINVVKPGILRYQSKINVEEDIANSDDYD